MNKKTCAFDLEGPLSVIDFAADIGKLLNQKPELGLESYDMGEFFFMISNYDDYIIDIPGVKEKLNIPDYQPGDTLRIMAPLYVACYSDNELLNLAQKNLGLLPGCEDLISYLQREWDIYVISTSYTQFAHTITGALNIPKDHVYCTDLHVEKLKNSIINIEDSVNILVKDIFQKYLDEKKDLFSVINDLNDFFWKEEESDYIKVMNEVKVRGGKRKEAAIEDISKRTSVPISEMIAIGDSITDINMLQRLKDEGGIAISFNGNNFTISHSNVAITTPNNLGLLPIFQNKHNLPEFLKNWESDYKKFQDTPNNINDGLLSKECKAFFIKHDFVPQIMDLNNKTNKELDEIVENQKKMRKQVRGWAGNLG